MLNFSDSIVVGNLQEHTSQGAVIIFHGYGADANDLKPIAEYFYHHIPQLTYVLPNAPQKCEMGIGYQWFNLRDPLKDDYFHQVKNIASSVNDYIDEVIHHLALEADKYALAGFSQGGMLSLYLGLTRRIFAKAILSYSGMFIGADKDFSQEFLHPFETEFLLVHGEDDDIVAPFMLDEAKKIFQQQKLSCHTHKVKGLGHGIEETGLQKGINCLRKSFNLLKE